MVASLAGGEDGEVFNVNADTVAESLAVALGAQKLIFLTGAPGVLRDRNDPSTLVTFADPDDLAGLMASGVLTGGMRPKVRGLHPRGHRRRRAHPHHRRPGARRAAARGVHRRRLRHHDRRPKGEGDVSGGGSCRLRSSCCSELVGHPVGERRGGAHRGSSWSETVAGLGARRRARRRPRVRIEVRGLRAGPDARAGLPSRRGAAGRRAGPATRSRPPSRAPGSTAGAPATPRRRWRRCSAPREDLADRGRMRRRPAARPARLRRGDQEHHHGAAAVEARARSMRP